MTEDGGPIDEVPLHGKEDGFEAIRRGDTAVILKPPLELLREPFPTEVIGLLPKQYKRNVPDSEKSNCPECGAYVGPHIHLDYIGHAAVTDRLLSVDPYWTWEPIAKDEHGLPLYRDAPSGREVELWIRLYVHTGETVPALGNMGGTGLAPIERSVSRIGVGVVDKDKDDLAKQLISDAIKNAAMRFGVALELWSKDEIESQIGSGRAASRKRPAPKQGARRRTSTEPGTEGTTGWASTDRNKVVRHLARELGHTDKAAQENAVAKLLGLEEPEALVRLTEEQGKTVMEKLGLLAPAAEGES